MKTIASLFLTGLFLWSACNAGQTESNTEETTKNQPPVDSLEDDMIEVASGTYFIKRYDGTINNKYPISMVLINWGDGFLSGRYWYQGKNKLIQLSGELSDSLSFQITETVNFKETGTFEGILNDPSHLTGWWYNPKRSQKMSFDMMESSTPDSSGWSGNWHLNEIWDEGLLLIGNVGKDSFDFALSIVRSSHIGTIEGQAKIIGSRAFYSMKDFEEEPCKLTFVKQEDYIMVDQGSSNFACGFGARAHADGKYEQKNLLKKAKLAYGTKENAVFPTKELHDNFKLLVGNDSYTVFAFNMQITENSISEAQVRPEVTVVKGFIGGLVGSNEAIILYDRKGKIWAATIDFDKTNNELLVRYFTNDPLSLNRLPAIIEDWREGFKSYRVVFPNQPL